MSGFMRASIGPPPAQVGHGVPSSSIKREGSIPLTPASGTPISLTVPTARRSPPRRYAICWLHPVPVVEVIFPIFKGAIGHPKDATSPRSNRSAGKQRRDPASFQDRRIGGVYRIDDRVRGLCSEGPAHQHSRRNSDSPAHPEDQLRCLYRLPLTGGLDRCSAHPIALPRFIEKTVSIVSYSFVPDARSLT